MRARKSFAFFVAAGLALIFVGCGGYSAPSQPPPSPTSVTITPASASVPASTGTQNFTATVGNDYLSKGVTWALSGMGCNGATCGSLINMTTSSVTYNAPAAIPNPATVILAATSVNDTMKSSTATITVTSAPATGASAVSVTITDTPPAGVTLLSFEVAVTGATLNPGNVDLLGGKGPIRIEVKQLETESAFLSTATVAPGTFASITLTFANPELTFKNDSGATLAGCAVGAVCEIKPTGPLTSTVNFPGSGIVVMANSPTGIQVDVNPGTILNATLGVDFSLAGAVSAQQLAMKPGGELGDLDDFKGAVQNLDAANKKFTLHTANGDFPITTDSNTEIDFEACAANNFTCLQNNQFVEVDVELMAGGVFLAKKIEFEDDTEGDELEGIVFKIGDAAHFEMVVVDELKSVNNVNIGNPTVVTLSNPEFRVKDDGLQVPSALQGDFEGATDTSQLLPGQTVQIRLTSPANPGPPVAVTADRVRLRMTQFTASVKAGSVVPPNFSVDTLPALFITVGISDSHVQTSSETDFEGVSGVSALADGNAVSLRGLLFKSGALPPELIAKKIRKR
jgi:predicted component of type VI protein secretion system